MGLVGLFDLVLLLLGLFGCGLCLLELACRLTLIVVLAAAGLFVCWLHWLCFSYLVACLRLCLVFDLVAVVGLGEFGFVFLAYCVDIWLWWDTTWC